MAGRGAGDGLVQYAGGKLRSRLCESLRERICLEETVSCTASTVVRMCPSNFAKTVFIKISKSFSSETPCSATVCRPHTAPAHPLPPCQPSAPAKFAVALPSHGKNQESRTTHRFADASFCRQSRHHAYGWGCQAESAATVRLLVPPAQSF